MVDMSCWNVDNLDDWFEDMNPVFIEAHVKYRRKVNLNQAWNQYKEWVQEMDAKYRRDRTKYDYFHELSQSLASSSWCEHFHDLSLIFDGILTTGYSNAFAEALGHIGNVCMPAHRRQTGFLYLEALGMYPTFSFPYGSPTFSFPYGSPTFYTQL